MRHLEIKACDRNVDFISLSGWWSVAVHLSLVLKPDCGTAPLETGTFSHSDKIFLFIHLLRWFPCPLHSWCVWKLSTILFCILFGRITPALLKQVPLCCKVSVKGSRLRSAVILRQLSLFSKKMSSWSCTSSYMMSFISRLFPWRLWDYSTAYQSAETLQTLSKIHEMTVRIWLCSNDIGTF